MGCGASDPGDTALADLGDVGDQAVVQGRVLRDGGPLTPAYVRLLDEGGDFVGEVPAAADGSFRFFAASGTWTLRVLASGGASAEQRVVAQRGAVAEVELTP
ncbi:MAG: DUF1416 domain-containing protein [Streptosporangiaceae bacterium]